MATASCSLLPTSRVQVVNRCPQPGGELDLSRWLLLTGLVALVGDALLTQLGVRLWRRRRSS